MALRQMFQAKLEKLQADIIKMGKATAEMIDLSLKALVERDPSLVDKVLELENVVDDYDNRLEQRCARLIATQQPMAKDLRIIATAFKVITDVERIGDYSVDIAFKAKVLAPLPPLKPYRDFPRMAQLNKEMLTIALEAYASRDLEACKKVGEMDHEVDYLYNVTFDELIDLMKMSPENVERGAHLLLIGRYLERIGDHITNIAERIIYMETGEIVSINI